MQSRAKCGICHKFVKVVSVDKPREKSEVNFICKEHGVVNSHVEFEKR